jgi:hypothetical protein
MHRPIWELFINGSDTPVAWIAHKPNVRFAIYNPGGTTNPADDLVWDKETGLIWPRNANLLGQQIWLDSNRMCREMELGNRSGWRLPTVEELSSLVDPSQPNLALPAGHPFVNVQFGSGVPAYWSSTNNEIPPAAAYFVNFWRGTGPILVGLMNKTIPAFVWPVRGGRGGVNWNS